MLLLDDFECPTGHVFEELADRRDANPVCPTCNATTTRLIGAPRMDPRLGVHADAFSTMGDKWARIRRQRKQIELKKVRDHGPNA